jgi:hypothetical protein
VTSTARYWPAVLTPRLAERLISIEGAVGMANQQLE